MTMAALGEVIKSVLILGDDFDYTIARLNNMGIVPMSRNYNQEFKEKLGFSKTSSKTGLSTKTLENGKKHV
jgi:hypothetical protein